MVRPLRPSIASDAHRGRVHWTTRRGGPRGFALVAALFLLPLFTPLGVATDPSVETRSGTGPGWIAMRITLHGSPFEMSILGHATDDMGVGVALYDTDRTAVALWTLTCSGTDLPRASGGLMAARFDSGSIDHGLGGPGGCGTGLVDGKFAEPRLAPGTYHVVAWAGGVTSWTLTLHGATIVSESRGTSAHILTSRDFTGLVGARAEAPPAGFYASQLWGVGVRVDRGASAALEVSGTLVGTFGPTRFGQPGLSADSLIAVSPMGPWKCACTFSASGPLPGRWTFHLDGASVGDQIGSEIAVNVADFTWPT